MGLKSISCGFSRAESTHTDDDLVWPGGKYAVFSHSVSHFSWIICIIMAIVTCAWHFEAQEFLFTGPDYFRNLIQHGGGMCCRTTVIRDLKPKDVVYSIIEWWIIMLYSCIFIPNFSCVWRLNAHLTMLYWKCTVWFFKRHLTFVTGVSVYSLDLALKVCQRME